MPFLSHVPFLLSGDGSEARLHLVRSTPITRALLTAPRAARIAVSGPDGYISPDWYGLADQVPTWNYVAVHLTARLTIEATDGTWKLGQNKPEAARPGAADGLEESGIGSRTDALGGLMRGHDAE